MHSDSNLLYREIKKISVMHSLIIARYFLLLACFSILFYYLAHRYKSHCIYIGLFSLLAPNVLEFAITEKKHCADTVILPTLKKSYAYEPKKYISLLITFWLCNILLIVWQFSAILYPTSYFIANFFPAFALSGHILIYIILSYYYRFKLHSQLLNNQW